MRDEYAAAVADMASAKLGDTELPEAAPEREAAPVMDLMAALRASLEGAEKNRAKPAGKKSTAKKTSPKSGAPQGASGRRAG
jgi:DNA end-binding protein Ku